MTQATLIAPTPSTQNSRRPFAPIIEGGVAPKALKLSAQWIMEEVGFVRRSVKAQS